MSRIPAILKTDAARRVYARLLAALEDVGPFDAEVKKTSIHLSHGRAFAGVHPRAQGIVLQIVTDAPLAAARISKVEQVSRSRFHNTVRLERVEDVDARLLGWLRTAYALTVAKSLRPASIATVRSAPPGKSAENGASKMSAASAAPKKSTSRAAPNKSASTAAVKKPDVSAHAQAIEKYLSALPDDRRTAIEAVRKTVRAHLPRGYEEVFGSSMIFWQVPMSVYPDTYNGLPLMYAALASRKTYMTLYLVSAYASPRVAAELKRGFEKSGKKLDLGKSCVRFKNLDDLALDAIGTAVAAFSVSEFVKHARAAHSKTRRKT